MRKFLTMFAFAAAIVLGALSLASCGDDDDHTKVQKYSFTYEAELNSTNSATLNSGVWEDVRKEFSDKFRESSEKFNFVGTDFDAGTKFMNYTNSELYSTLTKEVDTCAKRIDDTTLTLTVKLLKDGNETHHTKVYRTSYFGF